MSYKIHARIKSKLIKQSQDTSLGTEINNSFLQQVTYNSDVDFRIRRDIQHKFKTSQVNEIYKFPRSVSVKRNKPQKKKRATTIRLSMEKSLPLLQKTKSDIQRIGLRGLGSRPVFKRKLKRKNPSGHLRVVSDASRSRTPLYTQRQKSPMLIQASKRQRPLILKKPPREKMSRNPNIQKRGENAYPPYVSHSNIRLGK